MAIIRFNYADVTTVDLKGRRVLKSFIVDLFQREGKALKALDYIFCSDGFLLGINNSFLKHDFYTDVVTFDLSEGDETVGEVYISIDRVKENSTILLTPFNTELLRVIFHGALHLIGYKDKKKSEITIMRQKEDYYLQSFAKK